MNKHTAVKHQQLLIALFANQFSFDSLYLLWKILREARALITENKII